MSETIHDTLADELKSFGGVLRCDTCGAKKPLGDIGHRMRSGWPECCGYTMRWVTARQLALEVLVDEEGAGR